MPDEVLKFRCNWPGKVLQLATELATREMGTTPATIQRIYCFEGLTLDLHRGCLTSAEGDEIDLQEGFVSPTIPLSILARVDEETSKRFRHNRFGS